jgi:hypothetical protein
VIEMTKIGMCTGITMSCCKFVVVFRLLKVLLYAPSIVMEDTKVVLCFDMTLFCSLFEIVFRLVVVLLHAIPFVMCDAKMVLGLGKIVLPPAHNRVLPAYI